VRVVRDGGSKVVNSVLLVPGFSMREEVRRLNDMVVTHGGVRPENLKTCAD
jgi:hypothetical protein